MRPRSRSSGPLLLLLCVSLAMACVRPARPPSAFSEAFEVAELYRSVVFVSNGVGGASGVVIEPDLVLTAGHVVTGAEVRGQVRWVDVFAPVWMPGGIAPSPTRVRGFVVARDTHTDLALVRLQRALEGVVPLEVSPDEPVVGEPVACVGHGRGHLMWSTRRGHVEAVGDEEVRTLRDRACVHGRAENCHADRFGLREMAGEIVETSCRVSGGDSGGPLVDSRGRLVGIASYYEYAAPSYDVAYFVHPRAIRTMLATRPTRPLLALPEVPAPPARGLALDFDQDGAWESLVEPLGDGDELRTWFDLDGESPLRLDDEGQPTAAAMAAFRPELVLVESVDRGPHLFVDSTDDDELDTLVFLDRRGFAARGVFRRRGDTWERDAAALARWRSRIDDTLVGPASRERWALWLEQGGERPWEGPRPSALRRGHLEDLDGDGRLDALVTVDRDVHFDVLWEITAVDVDQAWPTREGLAERLASSRSGIDFVVFASPDRFCRVWYDRDGDGSLETRLDADADGIVTHAEHRTEGEVRVWDEPLGTLVGRADFVRGQRTRAAALLREILGVQRLHHEAGLDLRVLLEDEELGFDSWEQPPGVYRGQSLQGAIYAVDVEGDAIDEPAPDVRTDAEAFVVVGAASTQLVVDVDHDAEPELVNLRLVLPTGEVRCWSTQPRGDRYGREPISCESLFDLSALRGLRVRAPLQTKLRALAERLGEGA